MKRKSVPPISYYFSFFLLILSLSVSTYSHKPEPLEIISVEKKGDVERQMREMDLDLLMEWENRIYVIADAGDMACLQAGNIAYEFETHKFLPMGRKEFSLEGGINGKYHSYREIEADLKFIETSFPQVAKVFDIGMSLEQRKIYALKISDNVAIDEAEAEVLFLGCHHAREWISVEVPFLLGKYLAENYSSDPVVKNLVDRSEIWIVPLVNPDGLEYSLHFYRYWRKNRRANVDGTYGVDLNRNYGYKWGIDDEGSSASPSSETYRGSAAFSEPETQAVRDFFLQKNFRAMISYHSYTQIILYPWGHTTSPSDKNGVLDEMAWNMSILMQPVNGRLYDYGQASSSLYLTNGDTTDWTYGVSGIPSFTIELPPVDRLHGQFFNAEADIEPIFRENLPAMLYLVNTCIQSFEPHKQGVDEGEPDAGRERKTKNP